MRSGVKAFHSFSALMIYQMRNCEPSIIQFSFSTVPKEMVMIRGCSKGGGVGL